MNQNKCPYAYISEPMGVKGNPSIAELMCYFCNLSLDLQTRAPEPRNHQKEKTGAAVRGKQTNFCGYSEFAWGDFTGMWAHFLVKIKTRSSIIKESSFWMEALKDSEGS